MDLLSDCRQSHNLTKRSGLPKAARPETRRKVFDGGGEAGWRMCFEGVLQ